MNASDGKANDEDDRDVVEISCDESLDDDEAEDRTTVTINKIIWPPKLAKVASGQVASPVVTNSMGSDDKSKPGNEAAYQLTKRKRKNVSGSEKNRRRKARAAMMNPDSNPPVCSTPQPSNKRVRSPCLGEKITPPPKKTLDKTPPVNRRPATFKEVVQESLTYYVVGANVTLNAEQVGAVMGNIIWELEKYIGTGIKAPSFNGKKVGESEIEMRCADNRTVEWLLSTVPQLKPWRKASLKVMTKVEWETMHKPKRMLRMSVVVPWPATGAYFMDVLRSNNPELKTKYWEIKNVHDRGDGTKFYLKVDEVSAELLRARGYKAFWLLDVIQFKLERAYGGAGGSNTQAGAGTSSAKSSSTAATSAAATATSTETATKTVTTQSDATTSTKVSEVTTVSTVVNPIAAASVVNLVESIQLTDLTGKYQRTEKADNTNGGSKVMTVKSVSSKTQNSTPARSNGRKTSASRKTVASESNVGNSKVQKPKAGSLSLKEGTPSGETAH